MVDVSEPRALEYLGEIELDEDTAQHANAMIDEAEQDIANFTGRVRVSLRWSREQVEVVKRAAATRGVPYQTYLTQVVMKQALTDLGELAAGTK